MKKKPKTLYDTDYFAWTVAQADLLRNKEYGKIDHENLIEEIESLGRLEKWTLRNHLQLYFLQKLRWEVQPAFRCETWKMKIELRREQVKDILKESSSLRKKLPQIVKDSYYCATLSAISETGFDEEIFPKKCPWKISDLIK